MEFLPSSESVRRKLHSLFCKETRGRRRVIMTAFVGRDAEELLPDFRDVEVYCWPLIGATDPHSLDRLREKDLGARIFLADNMHSKLYWVDGKGYVVTSANLSQRALGQNVQEEIGVFSANSSEVQVDLLLDSLSSRKLTDGELKKLQRQHDIFWSHHPKPPRGKPRPRRSFERWLSGAYLRDWKLSYWNEDRDEAPSTAKEAEQGYGIEAIYDFTPCGDGQLEEGDWVLCFRVTSTRTVTSLGWLHVELLHKLTEQEATEYDYSHEAVQLRELTSEHLPPFKIDKSLRTAFKTAAKMYGVELLMQRDGQKPTRRFLDILKKVYLNQP